MPPHRPRTPTHGRNWAGAQGFWRAMDVTDGDFGKPIIAVAKAFRTILIPGGAPSSSPRSLLLEGTLP